ELLPAAPELARLEVEEGFVTLDAHPHRRVLLAAVHGAEVVDIALGHGQDGVGGGAPGGVGDEEFAFDFEGHGERSWWLGVGGAAGTASPSGIRRHNCFYGFSPRRRDPCHGRDDGYRGDPYTNAQLPITNSRPRLNP